MSGTIAPQASLFPADRASSLAGFADRLSQSTGKYTQTLTAVLVKCSVNITQLVMIELWKTQLITMAYVMYRLNRAQGNYTGAKPERKYGIYLILDLKKKWNNSTDMGFCMDGPL